jgi:sulfate-transporting ATPase
MFDRFEAVSARFAEDLSEAEMDALVAEQGELQEGIDQAGARDLDRTVEIAKDALHWRRSTSKRAGASAGAALLKSMDLRLSQELLYRDGA